MAKELGYGETERTGDAGDLLRGKFPLTCHCGAKFRLANPCVVGQFVKIQIRSDHLSPNSVGDLLIRRRSGQLMDGLLAPTGQF
jgi:hypothetical protein